MILATTNGFHFFSCHRETEGVVLSFYFAFLLNFEVIVAKGREKQGLLQQKSTPDNKGLALSSLLFSALSQAALNKATFSLLH